MRFTAKRVYELMEELGKKLDLEPNCPFEKMHGEERSALDLMTNTLNAELDKWEKGNE